MGTAEHRRGDCSRTTGPRTGGRPIYSRRGFLATAGTAALATQLEALDFASSLLAAETSKAPKPRVAVVTFRKEKGGGCVWPPSTTEELAATQKLLHRTLQAEAAKCGVDLTVLSQRVTNVGATLEQVQRLKPDGLLVVAMDFDLGPMIQFCRKRGKVPTIVYGNIVHMGRSFDPIRRLPRTLLAHTNDVGWLRTAVRMHRALWDVNHLKLLDCPCPGYYEELKKLQAGPEVKAIAAFYRKNAKGIEPACANLLVDSAKHYVVLRRLMARRGCNGVTVRGPLCVGAGSGGNLPACLAVSKLLDEGTPAVCQGDSSYTAGYCQRLAFTLFGRPGFMGNITFDSVDNHLVLSHCTSALKLEGLEKDYRAPFKLRNFHANRGVSLQVSWPLGKPVTVLDRLSMKKDLLTVASGRVVENNDGIRQPPCGGCRTVVEIKLDWRGDIMDLHPSDDLHASLILGDFKRPLMLFCKLAGLTPVDITGKPVIA
ncbi:MAG TPA: hypothetical protein VM031_05295 [Phycisphaerae bacterium]|nr:hypothetical protein [Phycisphaerae bacterium]